MTVTNLPEPPEGMEIANVDIVVRLREALTTVDQGRPLPVTC